MFSKQDLFCCICGIKFQASVATTWHGFDKAVCGQSCFDEKEWRRVLSSLGKPYRPHEPPTGSKTPGP